MLIKQEVIEFIFAHKILQLGDVELKSGRISPYFFNFGLVTDGHILNKIAGFLSEKIISEQINFDVVFGPAYKGIFLATATAMQLAKTENQTCSFAFNRKEVKDHGEGGSFIGADVRDKNLLLVDDVISAGRAFSEVAKTIEPTGSEIHSMMVVLDRQEVSFFDANKLTKNYLEEDCKVKTYCLVNLEDIENFLQEQEYLKPKFSLKQIGFNLNQQEVDKFLSGIKEYRKKYGLTG